MASLVDDRTFDVSVVTPKAQRPIILGARPSARHYRARIGRYSFSAATYSQRAFSQRARRHTHPERESRMPGIPDRQRRPFQKDRRGHLTSTEVQPASLLSIICVESCVQAVIPSLETA